MALILAPIGTDDGRPCRAQLHLKHIAFAGDQRVHYRINKEAEEEPGDDARHNNDGEGALGV